MQVLSVTGDLEDLVGLGAAAGEAVVSEGCGQYVKGAGKNG